MSIHTIIIQGIGFAGLALFALSFQIKSNKALYLAQTLGNCMFGIQFLLLGQLTGCLSLFLLIIRNLLLMHYQEWDWVRWKGWIEHLALSGGAGRNDYVLDQQRAESASGQSVLRFAVLVDF